MASRSERQYLKASASNQTNNVVIFDWDDLNVCSWSTCPDLWPTRFRINLKISSSRSRGSFSNTSTSKYLSLGGGCSSVVECAPCYNKVMGSIIIDFSVSSNSLILSPTIQWKMWHCSNVSGQCIKLNFRL